MAIDPPSFYSASSFSRRPFLKRPFESAQTDHYHIAKRARLDQWLDNLVQTRRHIRMSRQTPRLPPTPPQSLVSTEHSIGPSVAVASSADYAGTRTVRSSGTASECSVKSTKRLVEQTQYRRLHLGSANIYHGTQSNQAVDDVAKRMLVPRSSPQPSCNELNMSRLSQLEFSATEAQIQEYYRRHILPERYGAVQRVDQQCMPHVLPSVPLPLSKPIPDSAYGLNLSDVEASIERQIREVGGVTNAQGDVAYTFVTIEFKGDSGTLSTALNQCLGDAAACLIAVQRLNRELSEVFIEEVCFSISVTPALGFVHAMGCSEGRYEMVTVARHALGDYAQLLTFRRMVRNILDWGNDRSMKIIQALEHPSRSLVSISEAHSPADSFTKRSRRSSAGVASSSKRTKRT